MFHWLDFLACLYSLALRRTILFRYLLYHGSDFLLLQTLVGMFLSIDFPIPDLKESHKSSTVEEGGALVISLETGIFLAILGRGPRAFQIGKISVVNRFFGKFSKQTRTAFLVSLKTKLAITHTIAIKLKEKRMQF